MILTGADLGEMPPSEEELRLIKTHLAELLKEVLSQKEEENEE